ncbi:MAG: isoquinoline 1-oxidoreductase alpha subunit [Pseudomonadota bacterium]|jgi:isoquinoline 1-oxidoreductase alpha subunit
MDKITLDINGREQAFELEPDQPLLWLLRDELELTGTKFGCGKGLCGACTVQVDGQPARACVTPAAGLAGRQITTIEGAQGRVVEAVKAAWLHLDVAQCGYCQPGQIMAASALLARVPRPSDEEIDQALSANLCRCGTYPRIRAAVHFAAESLATQTTL